MIKILQDLTQSDEDSLFSSSGSLGRQSDTPYSPDTSLFSLPKLSGAHRQRGNTFGEKNTTNPFLRAGLSNVGHNFSEIGYDYTLHPSSEAEPTDLPGYVNVNYYAQNRTGASHAYSSDHLLHEHQSTSRTGPAEDRTGIRPRYSGSNVDHSTQEHHTSIRTGHDLPRQSDSNAKQQPQKYQINIGPGHDFSYSSNSNDDQHHQTYQVSIGTGQVAPGPGTGHNMSDFSNSSIEHVLPNFSASEAGHFGYSGFDNDHQQLLQVSTGTEPLLPPLYSSSEDSLDYARASRLSMIPEEDETYELGQRTPSPRTRSHENLHRSHDSPSSGSHPQYRLHDVSFVTSHDHDHVEESFNQLESQQNLSGEMPWYQTTPSQDEWQTTPAYRPAWSENLAKPTIQSKAHFVNHALKFVVKEDVVPELQVSQILRVLATRLSTAYAMLRLVLYYEFIQHRFGRIQLRSKSTDQCFYTRAPDACTQFKFLHLHIQEPYKMLIILCRGQGSL